MTYRMTHPYHHDYDCDDVDEVIERLREYADTDDFDDYLNDCYGTVNICGHVYDAAEALRDVNSYAYDEDFGDWLDMCEDGWRYDLERLDDGDDTRIGGYTIACLDEDDDEAPERYEVRMADADGRDLLEDYFDTLEAANAACDALNADTPVGTRYYVRHAA